MKKREIVIFSIVIVILFLVISLLRNNNKTVLMNEKKEDYLINSNAITMMYETASGSGEYETTTDTSWPQKGYVFNERLSGCENGGTLTWNSETNRVIMVSNTSDRCYVYFDKYEPIFISDYIINEVYESDGINGLYYHDGVGSYTNADQEAGDNSYRYSGANPNNYVCFGSDAATCPSDNLYRIIGVFGSEVKLIKNTSIGDYVWDSGDRDSRESNAWNSSTKPDIRSTLNSTFIGTLSSTWQNKIATHSFEVGGMSLSNGQSNGAKTVYNYEVGTGQTGYADSMKIGLMYLSDYYYGAQNIYWTYPGYDSSGNDYSAAAGNNWMYLGEDEWTISRCTNDTYFAFYVHSSGASEYGIDMTFPIAVRPVFYLNSSISYVSGSGTATDPIRIT